MRLHDFGFLLLFLAIVGAVSLAQPEQCPETEEVSAMTARRIEVPIENRA